jgi:hypothetical protein
MATLTQRVTDLATRVATEFKTVKSKISGNTSGDLSGLTTTVKTSILAAINELVTTLAGKQNSLGFTPENTANKGSANGYASLDETGKVPAAQLPAYVDDVLEFANLAAFPATGSTGIIYVAMDTNMSYRWTGSAYVSMNGALALGETSATAYRGDRGKAAYDHSQIADGSNPHGTTFANLAAKPTTVEGFGLTDVYTKTEIGTPDTDFVATFNAALV